MKSSSKSLFFFGIYKVIASAFFIIYPQLIISLFHFPHIPLIWFRVIGIFTMVIGVYYIFSGLNNNSTIVKASAITRLILALTGLCLIYLGELPKSIVIVAVFDITGFAWTTHALIQEYKSHFYQSNTEYLDSITLYR